MILAVKFEFLSLIFRNFVFKRVHRNSFHSKNPKTSGKRKRQSNAVPIKKKIIKLNNGNIII